MKILITGATGMIGSKLVLLLLKNQCTVHYLSTSRQKIVNEVNYKGFYWNPSKGEIDEKAFEGVDVILHLAGSSISNRWTETNKKEIIDSRVVSAQLLYGVLERIPHQVKQFVSASAIGIYPDDPERLFDEEDTKFEIGDNFLAKVVSVWEDQADAFEKLGLKVCKIRTGLVLTKSSGLLGEILKPVRFGIASAFGSGRHWQSWIHLDDLVCLYFYAIQNQWKGVYNAVAPNPVTNEEMIRMISNKMHRPFFMPNLPKWFMKMILGEMHILLFISQKVSGQKVLGQGFQFRFPVLDQALDDLLKK